MIDLVIKRQKDPYYIYQNKNPKNDHKFELQAYSTFVIELNSILCQPHM